MLRSVSLDLFASVAGQREAIGPQACVLRALALDCAPAVLADVTTIERRAAFRHLETPGGFRMSVAMTNCGTWGWTSDRRGYRYTRQDPETGCDWPDMPATFRILAREAAAQAGFSGFLPDACLINRYEPGARLTLHQDRNEQDLDAPIVSVSLGVPATFLFGGNARADKTQRIRLEHGDVAVWGGKDRLRYHGVLALKEAHHPLLGERRINLTFRKVY